MSAAGVVVVAEIHGLAGSLPELRGLLGELAGESRKEAGCESFRLLAGEDPGEFVLLSGWTDEKAFAAHYETPHYQRYRDTVGPLLARPSDVTIQHVSATTHALDPNPPEPSRFD